MAIRQKAGRSKQWGLLDMIDPAAGEPHNVINRAELINGVGDHTSALS